MIKIGRRRLGCAYWFYRSLLVVNFVALLGREWPGALVLGCVWIIVDVG